MRRNHRVAGSGVAGKPAGSIPKALKEAGLVEDHAGTSRIYRIDPRELGPIRRWLDEQWARSLANFKRLANRRTINERGFAAHRARRHPQVVEGQCADRPRVRAVLNADGRVVAQGMASRAETAEPMW
jgi:hypothetical protein